MIRPMLDLTKNLEQTRCPRCPRCKEDIVRRSHRRGMMEFLASVIWLYPFRCEGCDYRFLAFRVGLFFMSWKTPFVAIPRPPRPGGAPGKVGNPFYWMFASAVLVVVLGVTGIVWVVQNPDAARELSLAITKTFGLSGPKKPAPADK
jgi:hypothetical protein